MLEYQKQNNTLHFARPCWVNLGELKCRCQGRFKERYIPQMHCHTGDRRTPWPRPPGKRQRGSGGGRARGTCPPRPMSSPGSNGNRQSRYNVKTRQGFGVGNEGKKVIYCMVDETDPLSCHFQGNRIGPGQKSPSPSRRSSHPQLDLQVLDG